MTKDVLRRMIRRPDIHAESVGEDPRAACQIAGAPGGGLFAPQAPVDIFTYMAEHQTEDSRYHLCQRCLTAVVTVH